MPIVVSAVLSLRSLVRSRAELHLEILALRHQLQVLDRSRRPRLRLTAADRLLWVCSRVSGPIGDGRSFSCNRPPSSRGTGVGSACSGPGRADTARAGRPYRPMSASTAQQLRNAFPNEECPAYLLHDRDGAFTGIAGTLAAMQIQDVVTAPRSPWQNAHVERFIGSIRRECLDHVIVLSAAGLQRVVEDYVAYYMRSRTHLSLDKDSSPSPPSPASTAKGR